MIFHKTTFSEAETILLGAQLAQLLDRGDIVAFWGELGSGKTCLIKGVCQGLNIDDEVTSPSFTIINEYTNRFPIYHFDFFRINSEAEIYGLGYEEYFYGTGICLIEWADRVINFLPTNRIDIYLKGFFEKGQENVREIKIEILGNQMQQRAGTACFIFK